jgi:hypothetical protein
VRDSPRRLGVVQCEDLSAPLYTGDGKSAQSRCHPWAGGEGRCLGRGGDRVAEIGTAGSRGVLGGAVPKGTESGLEDVWWCGELGLPDLEVQDIAAASLQAAGAVQNL